MYYIIDDNKYNGQKWELSLLHEKGSVKLKNRLFSILSVVIVLVLALNIFGLTVCLASGEESNAANTTSETTSETTDTDKNSGMVDTDEVANMNLGGKLQFGLEVALIGMLMVFAVLIILWAVIAIMGKIFGKAQSKKKEEVKEAAPVAAASEQDESEVVAIATAAIAAIRGEEKCAFKVISIQKIDK